MDFKYPITIYSKEVSSGNFVYRGQIGKYQNDITSSPAYMNMQFKSGILVPNESKILILDSWIKFYINKKNEKCQCLFVNDFIYEKDLNTNKNIDGSIDRKVKLLLKNVDNKLSILSRTNKAMYDTSSAFKSGIAEGRKRAYEEIMQALK